MANFPTHIGVGTLTSGLLATLTLAADVVAHENLVAIAAAGVLGSVLPDIDLKDSRPSKARARGRAAVFPFAALFLLAGKLSVAELWIVAALTFVGIRYVAHAIFHRMSYHRGIYHSILAGVFFAFFTAAIYKWLLGRHEGVAWLAAAFMFVGYMTHLILDEIYSVDVMDTRIKASFGTAVKLLDMRKPWHSVAMAAATIGVFFLTPSTRTFVDGVTSQALWTELHSKLLPRDKWFGVVGPLTWNRAPAIADMPAPTAAPAVPAVPASPIETGTLPEKKPEN
jgi:membrane-bound metal-dependent hydrolase YbcI (DUF457 family)